MLTWPLSQHDVDIIAKPAIIRRKVSHLLQLAKTQQHLFTVRSDNLSCVIQDCVVVCRSGVAVASWQRWPTLPHRFNFLYFIVSNLHWHMITTGELVLDMSILVS